MYYLLELVESEKNDMMMIMMMGDKKKPIEENSNLVTIRYNVIE